MDWQFHHTSQTINGRSFVSKILSSDLRNIVDIFLLLGQLLDHLENVKERFKEERNKEKFNIARLCHLQKRIVQGVIVHVRM